MFSKGISLKEWCIKNLSDKEYNIILNRWDYDLNNCLMDDVSFRSERKCWFKCPIQKHKSEAKNINMLTQGFMGAINCKVCNSFAQWGADNICEDFLEKYWDYDKNLGINPWDISKSSTQKIHIKCQDKDYHGNYEISCNSFYNGCRCGFCKGIKVHPLDSLGKILEDKNLLYLWSDKNEKSPYEYAPNSGKSVWWRCPEEKHEDYLREICNSNYYEFRCPKCKFSQGEEKIEKYLILSNINYESQKYFMDLLGNGKRKLSFDFYLPKYNILIEYQGQFHDGNAKLQTEKQLQKQKINDEIKRKYSINHNIILLEIWYWDFDRIEDILELMLISKIQLN